MQPDLFGQFRAPTQASVRLYADEIKEVRNSLGEKWLYIGLVAIPEDKYDTALGLLIEDRDTVGYEGEVHFTQLKNYSYAHTHNAKSLLARKWVERVRLDSEKLFHFYLLGLNLTNLQYAAFAGGKEQYTSIYNRFFRSSVAYALKSFFRAPRIIVTQVFHDTEERLERSGLFDWHTIWRLGYVEPGITFRTQRIEFIHSDHCKETRFPDDSHFLQLCDLLTGGFSQCLDARNTKDGCCEIAELLLPIAERLTDPKRVNNKNSRYHYVGRLSMSFFPSKKLQPSELNDQFLRARSGYYIVRRLLFKDRNSGQLSLPLDAAS